MATRHTMFYLVSRGSRGRRVMWPFAAFPMILGVTFQGKRAHASGGSREYPSTSDPSLRVTWYVASATETALVY